MGFEIAGGLGVKMATPDREVIVMVGDGSYLMMAQELVLGGAVPSFARYCRARGKHDVDR